MRPLRELLASFVAAVTEGSYADVRALQQPPHGNIGYGASGVVTALLLLGARAADSSHRSLARRWMRQIAASRAISGTHGLTNELYTRSSLWFGMAGIHYLRVLVGLANREPAATSSALGAYLEHATSPERSHDVVLGAAGNLIAISLLAPVVSDPSLDEAARRLAARVDASLDRARNNWSFAHGWPGLVFALLQHCLATRQPIPTKLVRLLRVQVARDAPTLLEPALQTSWCNGTSGQILLWAKAFEMTGDAEYLDRARADARSFECSPLPSIGLCCGTPGWVYACLALERVAPGEGWYDRALCTGLEFVLSDPVFVHATGLLQGQSGVVHLAIDLLHHTPGCGFPFVEALPIARPRSPRFEPGPYAPRRAADRV